MYHTPYVECRMYHMYNVLCTLNTMYNVQWIVRFGFRECRVQGVNGSGSSMKEVARGVVAIHPKFEFSLWFRVSRV